MPDSNVDPRILKLCEQVTAKRARAVIDHIIKHGQVTTEDLQAIGYDHAPRAARDVRELGIPLDTVRVPGSQPGKTIAAYRFGSPSAIVGGRLAGRKALPKALKNTLLERDGAVDKFTGQALPATALTIDHRIPYEVIGDTEEEINPDSFMLLDGSSQRSKSWSCEHCSNWKIDKNPDVCRACYWAFPENYSHMALLQLRRVDLTWAAQDVAEYDALMEHARKSETSIQDLIRRAVADFIQRIKSA